MKKVMVYVLCFLLAAGVVSGCGNQKPEPDPSPDNAEQEPEEPDGAAQEEEDKLGEDEDKQTENREEEKEEKDESETDTEEEKDAPKESDENQETKENTEKDKHEDLTMTVLREDAGTRDYTSLEELNPEPGAYIAVVVKTKKAGFWTVVRQGMEDAVEDLNEKMGYKGEDRIQLSFEGPAEDTDVESQINILDAVLSENPSILCLAAIDMESCEAQLETAAENDIPVIVLDSGVESELVNAVCATDNYAAGREAAKKLAEEMEGKGQAAVMTHWESSETSQERTRGFMEELTQNYPDIEIVNESHENEETSMTELAKAVLVLYPEVKGYYCTNETAANQVLEAVEASGKEVAVIGFDTGKQQIDAVKAEKELGVFAQNPYGMGYATVVAGIRADLNLENDAFIHTGYQWLDSTNIEKEEYQGYLYE